MDWATFVWAGVLLSLAIGVLRLIWRWLLFLLSYGPQTLLGLVIGHTIARASDSTAMGVMSAICAAGILSEGVRAARAKMIR